MIDKCNNKTMTVYLDENDIEALLNNGHIVITQGETEIKISKSLVARAILPALHRPIKAVNTDTNVVMNKRYFNAIQNSTMSHFRGGAR
ncbi:hypothetical protein [Macrococcus brunensis]|uniref:hypothetical protein n=1 Tax=Macrococcus brunensis TaxID=198483 RepID=UPI001EEF932B|nr:hypothetical protein [Macrococcus brunensis]ULG73202.1 hypothetical protein MGG13_05610 [Macrococcus brunensis]